MESGRRYLSQSIEEQLQIWGLQGMVVPENVAQHILDGATYWATELPDGKELVLLRLYSPVVERREVFLGNVLLNDFLFKALPRAVEQAGLGRAVPLLNDLENAYILWHGHGELDALRESYVETVLHDLPDLYFGKEDIARGIHGDVRGMLTFYKCNIEPFPTFVIPRAYLDRLLIEVGAWVQVLTSPDGSQALADAARIPLDRAESWRINVFLSLLTFFYCQDGREMQSFYTFLTHAIEAGRLPEGVVKAGFGFAEDEDFTKKLFNKRKSGEMVDFTALAQAARTLLHKTDRAIAEGRALEASPYLGTQKMLDLEPDVLVNRLLGSVQLGYQVAINESSPAADQVLACRFCGTHRAVIEEKNIIGGPGTGNRLNQSLKPGNERFCLRCALSSYLETKRLGMQFDDSFPVPKLYNTLFHYGHHQDAELESIQQQIDYVLAHSGDEKTVEELWVDLQQLRERASEHQHTLTDPVDFENWVPSALEVVRQMQQDVDAEVIPLGGGAYRLLVFILPQLRPGSGEGLEFVQQRFSHSRLAVITLLGFLRQLCGCDGPYYFQSVPRLTPGAFDANTFYVRGDAMQADAALRRYGLITEFARRVVPYRQGHSQLADWILMAEKLERDPLAVFSDVLRKSPIRGGDDYHNFRYKRLSNDFVPGMSVVDGSEYLTLFEHLRNMQEEI